MGTVNASAQQSRLMLHLGDRLKVIAATRVLMVTLLMGVSFLLNVNDVDSFDHTSNQGLFGLIIGTYIATVPLGIALRASRRVLAMAHVSFAMDGLLALALTLLTGGLESPFLYLFVLVALYGGIILGRAGGLTAAGYTTLCVAILALFHLGYLDTTWTMLDETSRSPMFRASFLGLGVLATGLLSGVLSERLENAQHKLEGSRRDIAALRNLNDLILRNLTSGLLTVDADGVVLYANPAARKILRVEGEHLKGVTLQSLGLENGTTDGSQRWEVDLELPGSTHAVLGLSRSALLEEDGSVAGELVTFQDLTELRQAEQLLAQRDRLATVGRFAAGIAHEIRNPLASISGSVEMLSSEMNFNDDDATLMRITLREIDRLNGLVQKILDYAVPRTLVRRTLNLAALIEECFALFEMDGLAIDRSFELDLDEHIEVMADEESVRQILLNLWRNAAEATSVGGRILTQATLSNGDVMLRVMDDGDGVPLEARTAIFEPFRTTKRGGTGLGLATVYQLVNENGGSVELRSTPYLDDYPGACFEIRLVEASSLQSQETMPASRDLTEQET